MKLDIGLLLLSHTAFRLLLYIRDVRDFVCRPCVFFPGLVCVVSLIKFFQFESYPFSLLCLLICFFYSPYHGTFFPAQLAGEQNYHL